MAINHTILSENKKIFPKSRVQIEDNEKMLKCAEEWISFYRNNPHLICK